MTKNPLYTASALALVLHTFTTAPTCAMENSEKGEKETVTIRSSVSPQQEDEINPFTITVKTSEDVSKAITKCGGSLRFSAVLTGSNLLSSGSDPIRLPLFDESTFTFENSTLAHVSISNFSSRWEKEHKLIINRKSTFFDLMKGAKVMIGCPSLEISLDVCADSKILASSKCTLPFTSNFSEPMEAFFSKNMKFEMLKWGSNETLSTVSEENSSSGSTSSSSSSSSSCSSSSSSANVSTNYIFVNQYAKIKVTEIFASNGDIIEESQLIDHNDKVIETHYRPIGSTKHPKIKVTEIVDQNGNIIEMSQLFDYKGKIIETHYRPIAKKGEEKKDGAGSSSSSSTTSSSTRSSS